MSVAVHYQVEQLLAEQGEYLPLEFLLQEGRLSYSDYEAWRNGELSFLDEALFGDPEQVRQQLAAAEHYLRSRGWHEEPVRYERWKPASGSTARPLRFCADPTLDACFHRRYRKPHDQPQMDLFTDSVVTILVNGIIQSLADRLPMEARRLLERLYEVAPDHNRLGELERLTEAAESLDTPVGDIGAELSQLQETLTPLAESLIGPASRNLLVPLWRRLSQALLDREYRADAPELHLSYTAAQALDWATARLAVEREPDWQGEPVLLERHARSCDRQHEYAAALSSWFTLCWRFPQQAEALESSSNTELRRQWTAFQDLDSTLPARSFPAWMLISRPALVRILPHPGDDHAHCPGSYLTLYRLQQDRAQPGVDSNPDDMALRARLKQQDPMLFRHFLSSIETDPL